MKSGSWDAYRAACSDPETWYGGTPDDEDPPLFLYQVDEGGASWWVNAWSGADAIAQVTANVRLDNPIFSASGATAKLVQKERAEVLCYREDDGTASDMWSESQRDPSRRIVACSEW